MHEHLGDLERADWWYKRENVGFPSGTLRRPKLLSLRRKPLSMFVSGCLPSSWIGGTIANDVGIIYARAGPIVVAFFASSVTGPYGAAEDRIGRLAQPLVAYFDGRK